MKVLTQQESDQLLAAIDRRDPFGERDHAMLVLALHTGLRVSELIGLNVDDVAFRNVPRQALYVRPEIAKCNRERLIPLNALAQDAVGRILRFNARRGFSIDPGKPLIVNRKHLRLSVRSVQLLVEKLRKISGIDVPASPHTLRHTFGNSIAQRTGNLRLVQALLGHRRLGTVEVYTHPSREDLTTAVQLLTPQGFVRLEG